MLWAIILCAWLLAGLLITRKRPHTVSLHEPGPGKKTARGGEHDTACKSQIKLNCPKLFGENLPTVQTCMPRIPLKRLVHENTDRWVSRRQQHGGRGEDNLSVSRSHVNLCMSMHVQLLMGLGPFTWIGTNYSKKVNTVPIFLVS